MQHEDDVVQLDGMIDTESDDDSTGNENDSDQEEINQLKNENAVRLLLTNARSLRPKTESLKDAFSSLGLNVACITETWYKSGRDLSDHLTEIEGSSGIRILHESRDGCSRKTGGGVAIAFDVGSCNLKPRSLKTVRKEHGVLCVVGVIGKVSRKVTIFSIYIPPAMRAAELENLKEALATEVGGIMKAYRDPIIMLAGDFNHRDIQGALNEVGDFTVLATGPTRGGNTIDQLLEEGNSGRSFYAATRKLSSCTSSPQWAVGDLVPGREPSFVCAAVLDFYGAIACVPAEPMPDIEREGGGLGHFSTERMSDLLKDAKKTESRVEGDPIPHLVCRFPGAFAVPVSAIFNAINDQGQWPARWKTEHLTIIPKVPNPGSLAECRNISCTSIFSKILEGVVLKKLRDELVPDPGQYGGQPKCGAEHMLLDIWEKVMEALEGGKSAAVLLGVDYEKAFNRMEHAVCLEQLRKLGASPESVVMVKAFLENRTMTISLGGHKANPVHISRGSPQGSVLGCMLYCVTTQLLTWDLRREQRLHGTPLAPPGGPGWAAFLYVDDTTLFDSIPISEATRHYTTARTIEEFHQPAIAGDMDELTCRAEEIGMAIHGKKTQLLVISPANGCHTTATIATAAGDSIVAVEELKLVGFTFGSSPGAGAHVATIGEKYKKKKWMLYHLRDAGFKGTHLYKLYCCYVRSVIEYCSPVYHPLLTQAQEVYLERLQRHALRVCFGYNTPIEDAMHQHNISTLKDHRVRRCDAFLKKAAASPRFGPAWFQQRSEVGMDLRSRREVRETQASSLRWFNSPLSYLRQTSLA